MPVKELLEEYPLYKSAKVVLPLQRHRWPTPAVKAFCAVCRSEQTYNMINDYSQYDQSDPKPGPGGHYPKHSSCVRLVYECASCHRSRRYYLLLIIQNYPHRGGGSGAGLPPPTEAEAMIRKVGQQPPWDISPDPQLAKKLGVRVDVFKKGLVCESQGFGIGAYAYYRRIIEAVIDELLEDIRQLVPEDGMAAYAAAVDEAAKSHRAVDKIEHVKDVLPASLRPGGANPLLLLHGALSQGLHSLPDEECLELATTVRGALAFLVHQVGQAKASQEQFENDLKKLLDRQAKQGGPASEQ